MSGKNYNLRDYLGKDLKLESLKAIYKNNDIDMELSILYRDIVLTLTDLVFSTYLGEDVMDDDDNVNHFNWCWNKTKETFSTEGFEMKYDDTLFVYFSDFFDDIFYSMDDKSNVKHIDINIRKLWCFIFNITSTKSKSDVDVFLELYELFTDSLF